MNTASVENIQHVVCTWWRHRIETFSALLAICAGNSPVPGEFPTQRPVTRSFDVFFELRLNKRLSKQSRGWWFEMLSCLLCRNVLKIPVILPPGVKISVQSCSENRRLLLELYIYIYIYYWNRKSLHMSVALMRDSFKAILKQIFKPPSTHDRSYQRTIC